MTQILIKDMSIFFPIIGNYNRSFKNQIISGRLLAKNKSAKQSGVEAVRNISLDIQTGERVALMGVNGSGKTTILRALSGIYKPESGDLTVSGRVASLLDLSSGFDPDATGYENIYLRGLLCGLSRRQIDALVSSVTEFSELDEFIYMPVSTYSSGMTMRLAFSITTSIAAEIILMDEWLSVGDANFTEKASNRLHEIIQKSQILVLATHDKNIVRTLCTRVITLHSGTIVTDQSINEWMAQN